MQPVSNYDHLSQGRGLALEAASEDNVTPGCGCMLLLDDVVYTLNDLHLCESICQTNAWQFVHPVGFISFCSPDDVKA
jgi:hypothetical protein